MDAAATGKRIAALRQQKGWTQKQLAEQLHVTDKAVSKWERGLNFPDLMLIEPLAAALGTTASALLGLEQDTPDRAVAAVSELAAREKRTGQTADPFACLAHALYRRTPVRRTARGFQAVC